MATTEYSPDICRKLQAKYQGLGLHRPMRVSRYDAGTELVYNVTGLETPDTARVHLLIEKFVGGGFAGQVYRVKILDIHGERREKQIIFLGGLCELCGKIAVLSRAAFTR